MNPFLKNTLEVSVSKQQIYGPIWSKIEQKAGYAVGRAYLVIDGSLPRSVIVSHSAFGSWIRSMKRCAKESASSKYIIF